MPKLLKPKALKPGDTLGVVAFSTPISACQEEYVQRAYAFLRGKGFRIVEAPNCRSTSGHSAGTIMERVRSFHSFLRDPRIDGILSFWGGMQSHQLLEYLDYKLIRSHPKAFLGFSDSTALQVGLHAMTGLVSFSSPAGITFAKPEVPPYTWDSFSKVVLVPEVPLRLKASDTFSDNRWYRDEEKKMRWEPGDGWRVFRAGNAEGPIIGGNVGTMLLLAGTPYWPDLRGRILFAEKDEAENPRTIDRMFTQLRQMGVFKQIRGLVVGRFHRDVGFRDDDSLDMILRDALRGTKFPVLTNVDFGHTDPLLTIPMGIRCRVDTRRRELTYLERAVAR